MLGCNESKAQEAAERFLAQVDRWNQETMDGHSKISLKYSTAAYAGDADVAALLGTLSQKMREYKSPNPRGNPWNLAASEQHGTIATISKN
jgi:hypothetical protein